MRTPYPSDVTDEEWELVAPYLTLMTEDAPQREHSLREVFNGLRYVVRTGGAWRYLPHDLPPWYTVYQQTQRWLKARVFEAMVQDLRELLRLLAGRNAQPSAMILALSHLAIHAGKRQPSYLRRWKTQKGQQNPHSGRYLGTSVSLGGHSCQ